MEIDGEFWFVAKDVCEALGYANSRDAISVLDDDEISDVGISDGSQKRHMNIINESGLYTLIMRSNKPAARKFRKWVTGTVLPALRKNGNFSMGEQDNDKLNYISRGIMNSARKIFDHALDCKNEKDFQVTVALDRVFKNFTGKSALETAGIKLVKQTELISHEIKEGDFAGCTWTECKEKFTWEHDLPGVSPENQKTLQIL